MMQEKQKEKVLARLRRIEGQVRGLQRMIEDDRYCIDILTQTASVVSALRGVEDLVMERHLQTCVADAMRNEDTDGQKEKIGEVMDVLSRFRRHG